MNKKRLSAIFMAILMMASLTITCFAEQTRIFIDLQEVQSDVEPQIMNQRTMVPVRAITEMIGCRVTWIAETQQVEIYAPNSTEPTITMQIGSNVASCRKSEGAEATEVTLDAPPVIFQKRTLVPLRFISEAIGYEVDYNVDSRDVYLFSPEYVELHEGEGIGQTLAPAEEEKAYVLSFRTKSWLSLSDKKKEDVVSIIARWWNSSANYVVEDLAALKADLDHQMETYFRNGVDIGVFETACDIRGLDPNDFPVG